MIFPLTERAGYSQVMALAEAAEPTTIEREKCLQKLTLLAEAEDALALEAQKVADTGGCAIRLRNAGLAAFARVVIGAIVSAPDSLVNGEILKLKEFAQKDLNDVAEKARRQEAAARADIERRWEVEARAMGVGEALAACETAGKLSLDGDKIVVRGGVNERQRVIIQTRRRDLMLALQGRERREVV
jgi:hypothetical protein